MCCRWPVWPVPRGWGACIEPGSDPVTPKCLQQLRRTKARYSISEKCNRRDVFFCCEKKREREVGWRLLARYIILCAFLERVCLASGVYGIFPEFDRLLLNIRNTCIFNGAKIAIAKVIEGSRGTSLKTPTKGTHERRIFIRISDLKQRTKLIAILIVGDWRIFCFD